MSFNRIFIIGNLGRDPELSYTPQGVAVCKASVATTEKRKDGDITTWFKVTVWRERAESFAKYFKKGDAVFIEGNLSQSEWTDRDGNAKTTLEVTATDWQFVGGKQE